MTLVVAQILDNGTITMLSDTKLLYEYIDDNNFNEGHSRQIYQAALPKIVILRHDLAVGIAGTGVTRALEAIAKIRTLPVEDLLSQLQLFDRVDFIVAALAPTRLWTVKNGQLDNRAVPRRAWVGDVYDRFQQLEARDYLAEFSQEQRLLASMQTLVHRVQPLTVGGYVIHLGTYPDGFRFSPTIAAIAPSHLYGALSQTEDGVVSAQIVVPPGVDPTMTMLNQFVGKPPTRGSLAMYVPPARTAWLFTEDEPWIAVPLKGDSSEEIVQAAAALGHRISMCECIDADHVKSMPSGFTGQSFDALAMIFPVESPPTIDRIPDRDLVVELCHEDGETASILDVKLSYTTVASPDSAIGHGWAGSDPTGIIRLAIADRTHGAGSAVQLAVDLSHATGRLPIEVLPVLNFLALIDAGRLVRLRSAYGQVLTETRITESLPGKPWIDRLTQACEALKIVQENYSGQVSVPDFAKTHDAAIDGWLQSAELLNGATINGFWADAELCGVNAATFDDGPIDLNTVWELRIELDGQSTVIGTVDVTLRQAVLSADTPPIPHEDHLDTCVVPVRMPGSYDARHTNSKT